MDRRTLLIGSGTLIVAGGTAAAVAVKQMGSMDDYEDAVAQLRAPLAVKPDDRELIRYATLAANGHNTQPWKFRVRGSSFEILPDFTRRTAVVDPDDHHLFASLGCAAENLMIAGTAANRTSEVRFDSAEGGKVVVEMAAGGNDRSPLFGAIAKRQSTRAVYDSRPVSSANLALLSSASQIPGVATILITERTQMNRIRDLVMAGNSTQMEDKDFVDELKHWVRFNPNDAMKMRDGLFGACTGNPSSPTWIGRRIFDFAFRENSENEKYAGQINGSAGIAVFVAEKNDPEHWVRAGRACQRFALQATALGLKQAYINQPVEVSKLRAELAALVGMPGQRPNIVMRFGYGPTMPMSLRRTVDAVLAV
ncbi:nitroreductase family protein [Altererythrobacter sp. ZODW24]|uniref:Acg family FMN-binding oxidoreductase n=1 Tax=Altererythrobacter sp. ZODW24 TaxID=2185142 RepID=UPI000DF7B49B|nr:nitroreductase family protein [Altererythrobacter sp. ZODW24]